MAAGVQIVDVRAGVVACITHFHLGALVRRFGLLTQFISEA